MKLLALVLCSIQHLNAETSQVTIAQLLERSQSQLSPGYYQVSPHQTNMDQEPHNILIVLPSSPYPVTSGAGISQAP
ncbi:hypothetical protein D5086_014998 [Populus alba]|uniref:Uncharacterized protein n=1 Tax=Populus alba TaxID=43335 RepID=A0ACC4BZQ5_POPAL